MEYIIEENEFYRVLDDGTKERLGWITDNGRGDALAVIMKPKEKWIEECKENGIPNQHENGPIAFWDNGVDIKDAIKKFYDNKC